MTLDFWALGLQAVNVLILVWLLSRVFWRPVAAAIAARQAAAKALIDDAQAVQAQADAALAEVTKTRAGLEAERAQTLDTARTEADAVRTSILAEARAKADTLLAAAQATIDKTTTDAAAAHEAEATELALTIAASLLRPLEGPVVQAAFLSRLVQALEDLSPEDRAVLIRATDGVEVVTPHAASSDEVSGQEAIAKAIHAALGASPTLRFNTDPNLIAGVELRTAHFTLRNSWQADLDQIREAVKDAV